MSAGQRPTIEAVLAGTASYDDLPADAQAVVRAIWAERIEERIESLDFAAEAVAEGRSWVEAGPDGLPVYRNLQSGQPGA